MNGANRETFAHLATALSLYSADLRRDGLQMPEQVAALLVFFADCAMVRQDATSDAGSLHPGHGGSMSNPLLLNKREAAGELRLSVRQLERILSNPESGLAAVRIEGAVRIRRADLDAFVAALGTRNFKDEIEVKAG